MVISTSFVFERKLSIDHLVEGVDRCLDQVNLGTYCLL